MRFTVFIIIALLVLPIFANPQKTRYIGFKHRGVLYDEILSNGVKSVGGGLLSDDKFGVSRYAKNKKTMLWLEKIVERDAVGVPSWEAKDVLLFDNLKQNQNLLFSYGSTCKQNGKVSLDLVVKVKQAPYQKTYKVEDAWRANTKKGKFEKITTKGIKCEVVSE
jgi:hypothetical protein